MVQSQYQTLQDPLTWSMSTRALMVQSQYQTIQDPLTWSWSRPDGLCPDLMVTGLLGEHGGFDQNQAAHHHVTADLWINNHHDY